MLGNVPGRLTKATRLDRLETRAPLGAAPGAPKKFIRAAAVLPLQ